MGADPLGCNTNGGDLLTWVQTPNTYGGDPLISRAKAHAETARGMACGLPSQNWPFRSSVSRDTVSEPSDSCGGLALAASPRPEDPPVEADPDTGSWCFAQGLTGKMG